MTLNLKYCRKIYRISYTLNVDTVYIPYIIIYLPITVLFPQRGVEKLLTSFCSNLPSKITIGPIFISQTHSKTLILICNYLF